MIPTSRRDQADTPQSARAADQQRSRRMNSYDERPEVRFRRIWRHLHSIEPPPPTAGTVGEIQSPDEGSVFGTGEEFRVSGSVRNLPQGDSVWLLAVSADAPNQDFYFANPDPVASNDGEWADTDSYAVAGRREIVLVQAEPACDNLLRAAAQTPSDARADTLGEGCRILSRRTLTIQ